MFKRINLFQSVTIFSLSLILFVLSFSPVMALSCFWSAPDLYVECTSSGCQGFQEVQESTGNGCDSLPVIKDLSSVEFAEEIQGHIINGVPAQVPVSGRYKVYEKYNSSTYSHDLTIEAFSEDLSTARLRSEDEAESAKRSYATNKIIRHGLYYLALLIGLGIVIQRVYSIIKNRDPSVIIGIGLIFVGFFASNFFWIFLSWSDFRLDEVVRYSYLAWIPIGLLEIVISIIFKIVKRVKSSRNQDQPEL